jgi:hypothetical protein
VISRSIESSNERGLDSMPRTIIGIAVRRPRRDLPATPLQMWRRVGPRTFNGAGRGRRWPRWHVPCKNLGQLLNPRRQRVVIGLDRLRQRLRSLRVSSSSRSSFTPAADAG